MTAGDYLGSLPGPNDLLASKRNANRHVGLALPLSGRYFRVAQAVPAIACYALIASVVMFAYARWYRGGWRSQNSFLSTTR